MARSVQGPGRRERVALKTDVVARSITSSASSIPRALPSPAWRRVRRQHARLPPGPRKGSGEAERPRG
eukprot:4092155-Prymnesium_polylepis.1